MIVIGSAALRAYGLRDYVNDFDVIMTPGEYNIFVETNPSKSRSTRWGMVHFSEGHVPTEIEIAHPGSTGESLMAQIYEHGDYASKNGMDFASPGVILALKESHKYLRNSPHFLKTMSDIHFLRGQYSVPAYLSGWVKERENVTYSYNHPNLNQKGRDFFNPEEVTYTLNHDDIHDSVKVGKSCAYKAILKDGAEVACSKAKFDALDNYSKLLTVLEEAYTLAIERHQVPNNFSPDRKKSFDIALKKVCTSITSGWFREFAWENYDKVVTMYDGAYLDKFKDALALGKIRPFGEW